MEGRIVSKEEAIESLRLNYSNEEIEVIFAYHTDHPIVESDGWLSWKKQLNNNDINDMSLKYTNNEVTQKEYMEYYRKIGYSLRGYWEIFFYNNKFNWDQWVEDKSKRRDDLLSYICRKLNIDIMLKMNKSQLVPGQKVVVEKQTVTKSWDGGRSVEVFGFYNGHSLLELWRDDHKVLSNIPIGTTLEVVSKGDGKKTYFNGENMVLLTDGVNNYRTEFEFFKRMVGLGDYKNLGDDIYELVICYKGEPVKTKKFKDIAKVKASLMDLMAYQGKVEKIAENYKDRVPEILYSTQAYWYGNEWEGTPNRKSFKDITVNKWLNKKLGDPIEFDSLAYYDELMEYASVTGRFGSAVRDVYKKYKDEGVYKFILCFVHEDYKQGDYDYLTESNIIKEVLKKTKISGSKRKSTKMGKTAIALEYAEDVKSIIDQLEDDQYYICDMSGNEIEITDQSVIISQNREEKINRILEQIENE